MRIEIVYAGPHAATAKIYLIDSCANVADALRLAAADPEFAAVDLDNAVVGVFGRVVSRQDALADGDRIEIYRGPAVDPKAARRARAGGPRAASKPGRS
jgi:putative ubiquitin-RnfH superfamily antitoxin RatB of RatAB toxin-antitoxin module